MRYARVLTRAALALAVIAFFPWPQMSAGDAGRTFALCTQFCNALSQACLMNCDNTCDEQDQPECKMICHHACLDNVRHCKDTCKQIMDPEPPGAAARRIVPRS